MNTPHERLTHSTFSLPLGEVHALVGSAVNARPLLFLHGFPDHPPTAVPFLEHLAETHRVVAPWLRGYAPSPRVGPYDLDTLAADALALIDRLGGQVDLVGHDWGGEITYTVCAAAPSHVRRAVTLAIPHPATFLRSLAHSKQWKKSWYMGLFQLPGANYLVRRRELALIDRLWRAWSPSFTLDSARRDELHACLKRSLPAPLEYYRAIVRPLMTFAFSDGTCVFCHDGLQTSCVHGKEPALTSARASKSSDNRLHCHLSGVRVLRSALSSKIATGGARGRATATSTRRKVTARTG